MKLPVHEGWKRQKGPLPPTRTVIFMDNTAGGRRGQYSDWI